MNKTIAVSLLATGAILGAIAFATLDSDVAEAAIKTITIRYDDNRVDIERGSFRPTAGGGGFDFHVCVQVPKDDGGTLILEQPCVQCSGPFAVATLASCIAKAKQDNGGL